ncbi:MAG: sulfatase-like hydrolase/transferase [Planctomycetota bacterium]
MYHRLRIVVLLSVAIASQFANAQRDLLPNILWLSVEDIGPHLGCYGDKAANTPNLDAFAKRSLTYDIAWSNYPVCAPARTTIITGVYPAATGSGHMRSQMPLPDGMKFFPQILRKAGFYCTNNSKTDYNLVPDGKVNGDVWDDSSKTAHYKNRVEGQPFFAVFNDTRTHESKIRKKPHDLVTDPATVELPAYHPDRPEIRRDWGQYYDNIHSMDGWVAKKLQELE